MLTSMEIVPPAGATYSGLVIPVVDSGPDEPITIHKIDGLEPVDSTVNTQPYDGPADGEFYAGSKRGKRTIVITFGLSDVEVARPLLFGRLMPKGFLQTFKFTSDGWPFQDVYISGYVESAPHDRFSQDPEIQISIVCPKPNFHSVLKTQTGVTGPDPIEFEYAGDLNGAIQADLDIGTTLLTGDVYFEVKNTAFVLDYRHFELEDVTITDDKHLLLTTYQGQKEVQAISLVDPPVNQLGHMTDDSFWIELWPGTNLFRIRTPDDSGTERNYILSYTEQYGSI